MKGLNPGGISTTVLFRTTFTGIIIPNLLYTVLLVKFLCSFYSENFLEDSFPFVRILKFYLKIHKSQKNEKRKETPYMSSGKMSTALDAAISRITWWTGVSFDW